MGKVTKFNSEAYAILEATPTQGRHIIYFEEIRANILPIHVAQQNQILEGKIQRRPSRTSAAKKPEKLTATITQPTLAPGSAAYGSTLGSVLSTSLGPSSSHGPQIFLRIHTADAVHFSTTIPVYAPFPFFFRRFIVLKSFLALCSVPRVCICKKHLSLFVASEGYRTQMITPYCLQIKASSFLLTVRLRVCKENESFCWLRRACYRRWTVSS